MKRKAVFFLIITFAAVLLAFFLISRSEKKVEFSKIQEDVNVKEDNMLAENTISENTPDNNTPVSDDSSEVVKENKSVLDEKKVSESGNKKEESASTPKITNKLANWGYEKSSGRKIDTIVIHSTYNITSDNPFDLDAIIYKEYKPYGVSPHYIIDRDGKIYRLVEDKNVAYHAGEAKTPDGRSGVNNFSIGIELVNSKTAKPTDDQYDSLKYLVSYIKGKYSIKYTLGHKDIAPGRKDDPWNFDWKKIK